MFLIFARLRLPAVIVINHPLNTRQLAEFVVAAQESAFAMTKTMNDRRMLSSLYNSLKDYLESKFESRSPQ